MEKNLNYRNIKTLILAERYQDLLREDMSVDARSLVGHELVRRHAEETTPVEVARNAADSVLRFAGTPLAGGSFETTCLLEPEAVSHEMADSRDKYAKLWAELDEAGISSMLADDYCFSASDRQIEKTVIRAVNDLLAAAEKRGMGRARNTIKSALCMAYLIEDDVVDL